MSDPCVRLTWFLHFHKAAGSSVVSLARQNGETLAHPHANGNPLTADGKVIRLWELSPDGLNDFVDETRGAGVSFVATEWGLPDLEVLASRGDVRLITVIREPIARLLSNYDFDRRQGHTSARGLAEYVDHHIDGHTLSNYYTRLLTREAWRLDGAPDHLVELAWSRLQLVDHVAVLEDPHWQARLSHDLNWSSETVHEKNSRSTGARRARAGWRAIRRGRLDLAGRPFARRVEPDLALLEHLRDANALDLDLYRRLGS